MDYHTRMNAYVRASMLASVWPCVRCVCVRACVFACVRVAPLNMLLQGVEGRASADSRDAEI